MKLGVGVGGDGPTPRMRDLLNESPLLSCHTPNLEVLYLRHPSVTEAQLLLFHTTKETRQRRDGVRGGETGYHGSDGRDGSMVSGTVPGGLSKDSERRSPGQSDVQRLNGRVSSFVYDDPG